MHRVQRVPAGEKHGRRHSSLITVAVIDLTEAGTGSGASATSAGSSVEDLRTQVSSGLVRVDTFRASGPGGQHRNKVSSAVRLTHLPTGVVVTATESRSQHHNRTVALDRLAAELADRAGRADAAATNVQRRAAFGRDRSFTWTGWRDEVRTGDGARTSMSRALAGRLGPLL